MEFTLAQKRLLAAFWFAAFTLLSLILLFHPVKMAFRGILLYITLPVIAAAFAGGVWGRPILNQAATNTMSKSLLRGIAVAAGAFVVFSLLYATALPFVEDGWTIRQTGDLFLLTSILGALMAAPIILFGGMLAGATLHWFGRKFILNQ